MKVWIPHPEGLDLIDPPLPADVDIEVFAGDGPPPSDPATVEVWVPPFLASAEVAGAMADMSSLRLIQLLTAGAEVWLDKVPEGVVLCDGRGIHTSSTAEWVMTAVLAYVRSFPRFVRAQAAGVWDYARTDELAGKRVLIVGAGDIGDAVADRLAPFEVSVTRVARRPRPGVYGIAELPTLLPDADVVVLLVPLTEDTRGMVDEGFLDRIRDGALLVNAARGPVVDTVALTATLHTGRIGAALDVTDPEPLPVGHPLWEMPNVLLTPHVGGSVAGMLPRAYRLAGVQLRRFHNGEPLQNVVMDGY
ncbi:MAG: 2-hydroxyacid dehydrogenase [Micromonosporaceae bacterium]